MIPAIIYGVAFIDLLKIIQHKKNYWEVVTWGVYMFLLIIFVWTELYQKLETITDNNLNFLLIIVQAVLFTRAVHIITPEEKDIDTKKYFSDNRKLFFLTLLALVVVNVAIEKIVFDDQRVVWMRPTSFISVLICAFVDKRWLRTSIWIFFMVILIYYMFFL